MKPVTSSEVAERCEGALFCARIWGKFGPRREVRRAGETPQRGSEMGVRCSHYPRRKVNLEKKTGRAAASFIAFLFTPCLRYQRRHMHNSVIYTHERAKEPMHIMASDRWATSSASSQLLSGLLVEAEGQVLIATWTRDTPCTDKSINCGLR